MSRPGDVCFSPCTGVSLPRGRFSSGFPIKILQAFLTDAMLIGWPYPFRSSHLSAAHLAECRTGAEFGQKCHVAVLIHFCLKIWECKIETGCRGDRHQCCVGVSNPGLAAQAVLLLSWSFFSAAGVRFLWLLHRQWVHFRWSCWRKWSVILSILEHRVLLYCPEIITNKL
jgi:hypothetical protein